MRDQHQRINRFKEGDLLALPAGFAHWAYNDGEQPVVAITVIDTSNSASQLDPSRRVCSRGRTILHIYVAHV